MSALAEPLAPLPRRRGISALGALSRAAQLLVFLAAVFFVVVPLAWLVLIAFTTNFRFPSLVPTSFTLRWWHTVLSQPDLLHSVFLSLVITPVVLAASALICLPAAYALGRFDFPGKRLVLLGIFSINAFPRIGLFIAMIPMLFALNLMGTFIGVIVVQLIGTILFMTWIPATAFAAVPDELVD
ncbi:MAG TPA: hypothetical protein VMD59_22715, partial [Acidimicrobiales bacterium]|nr:hypothetical protein [Acidimicrobiales bacterium]